MSKLPIILDCDPGVDDALHLLVAMASADEVEILGLTTVAGNVPLALTSRNARLLCDVAGRSDLRVYAGCERPLRRRPISSEDVHGPSGLAEIEIFEPRTPLASPPAVDFLIETALAAREPITIVATAPLTNLATAIAREPAFLEHVREIVLMGGARREAGNYSPCAEYNVLADPHAADVVFRCGRRIVVLGLDVTHQVPATAELRDRLRALGSRPARLAAEAVDWMWRNDHDRKLGLSTAALHDPCTIAYVLRPDLFVGKACHLAIETESELTMGHTVVDFWGVTKREPNVEWIHEMRAEPFYDLLVERIARFG